MKEGEHRVGTSHTYICTVYTCLMMTDSGAAPVTASGLIPPGKLEGFTVWLGCTYNCSFVKTYRESRDTLSRVWIPINAHLVSRLADDGPGEEDDVVLLVVLRLGSSHRQ